MPTTTNSETSSSAAFAPISHLPRRKSNEHRARPMFNFGSSSSSSSNHKHSSSSSSSASSSDDEEQPSTQATTPDPVPKLSLTLDASAIPFPSLQSPSPTSNGLRSGPPSPSVLPRTPSTPIILSNGKPLKPSLKSSLSAPHLPPMSAHLRSQSAPSTPNLTMTKNVHFPERGEDLQSVRLFRPAGRPAAVSLTTAPNGEETETETEGYDSSAAAASSGGYPFPITPPPTTETVIVLHPGLTSPVPCPSPSQYANVHLETLQLPRSRPYTLCGSVLVRNVSFGKNVVVRFTLDEWMTTSEVMARYVSSMNVLPPPLGRVGKSPLGESVGDALTSVSHASVGWDRFSFQIRLEDVERRLAEKTMWLVVRYQADGAGEWWDNNNGANYRVVFKKDVVPLPSSGANSSSSTASRALADKLRRGGDAGGLPPLQLKVKRPSLTTSLSFGAAPRGSGGVGGTGVMSPVSPVKGLSLKNYVPPKSPSTTPPSSSSALPSPPHSPIISRSSSPSPSPAPPALGLGNLDFNNTQSQVQAFHSPGSNDITPQPNSSSSVAFPSLGMGSPVGSPGTNASYEALVKQWCFGGSPGSVGVGGQGHGKSASEPAGAGGGGGWLGMSQRMGMGMVGVGEMA